MKRFDSHVAGGMALITVPILLCAVILAVFLASNAAAWLVAVAIALIAVGAIVCMKVMWTMLADGAADDH
jgi:FtsH-binding integral membrane protein